MNENLIIIKKILLKSFLFGFVFLFVMSLIYLTAREPLANFASSLFGIDPKTYEMLWLDFITQAKLILFFFFLIPGLAVKCVIKCKCKSEQE